MTLAFTAAEWTMMVCTILGSFGAMVAGIVAALKGVQVHREVRAPSSSNDPITGPTNGSLTEDNAYTLHYLTDLVAQQVGRPAPPPIGAPPGGRRADDTLDQPPDGS